MYLDKSIHAAWTNELNVYIQTHVSSSNLDLHRPKQHVWVTADSKTARSLCSLKTFLYFELDKLAMYSVLIDLCIFSISQLNDVGRKKAI